jgi:SAM-dependent methyltransferase
MSRRGSGRRRLATRLKRIAPLIALVRLVRALTSPLGRGRLTARLRGAQLFQPATVTWADRHPALFAAVAARLADRPAPRLLSFGCSTGEEAFALARALPAARVDAIDANPACIARARAAAGRLPEGARVHFACADAPDAFGDGYYDAVLCLSVLRHGDLEVLRPSHCTAFMPFVRFLAAVAALDARVRPGGLLVLWGCHFRFGDTKVAAGYGPLPALGIRRQSGPFWGPGDRRLPDADEPAALFVKLG